MICNILFSIISVTSFFRVSNTVYFSLIELLDEAKPQDEIPRIDQFPPFSVIIIMCLGTSFCVVLVTVLLVLFLCYWRQPEVHALSRALSLCIFLGCYLLLFRGLGISIIGPLCAITVDSCFVGIDLILATVLAKTLHIIYVFTRFKKTGNACSDNALLAMIALIVMGKITLLIVWNTTDSYHSIHVSELTTDSNGLPYFSVLQKCYSQQVVLWLFLLLLLALF